MNRADPPVRPEIWLAETRSSACLRRRSVWPFVTDVAGKLGTAAGSRWRGVTRERIVVRFCVAVWGVALAALIVATLSREFWLVRAGENGEAYPLPYYGVLFTELKHGPAIPGNDFSQVYASASSLQRGGSAYRPTNWRGGRPNYPPFTNWLYMPITRYRFEVAVLIQHAVSLLALAGATVMVLWKVGLRRHIVRVGLAQTSLYFLAPIGLTHIERAQFDLLVATAVLLAYGCAFLPGNRFGTACLSGLLGAIKWSAPVFLGAFAWLAFLLCRGKKRWTFFLMPVVTAVVTLAFWRELREYWISIQHWELNTGPSGLTLQLYLPRSVTRALPLLLPTILAALVWARGRTRTARPRVFLSISFPAAVSFLVVALCFGTMSFEYRNVVLLAMIPALVVWIEREPCVSVQLKAFTAICFGVMLPLAFRVFGLHHQTFDSNKMTVIFAFFGVLFFLESVYIASFARPSG